MVNAVPFLGFGFLDNFFMIIAGDYIESSIGAYMCLSTMAAAALGNTISDVFGLGLATYVERFCGFMGLERPNNLTPTQESMTVTVWTASTVSNKIPNFRFLYKHKVSFYHLIVLGPRRWYNSWMYNRNVPITFKVKQLKWFLEQI